MKTIKVTELTHEQFAPFGQFYNFEAPDGYALCGELLGKFFSIEISKNIFDSGGSVEVKVQCTSELRTNCFFHNMISFEYFVAAVRQGNTVIGSSASGW